MEIRFLTLEEALDIHRDQIARYGGGTGLRDMGLLQSALAMPQAGMGGEYFHTSVFEMASAYLFHLVRNHPFIDGNERAGAMAAFVFLKMNGHVLDAPQASFEKLVLQVAQGNGTKEEVTAFLRRYSRKQGRG